MPTLDSMVLEHLADKLFTRVRLEVVLQAFIARSADADASRRQQLGQAKRALTEAGGRIDRLLQMVEQGLMSVDDPVLKERLESAKLTRVAAIDRVRMPENPGIAGTSAITSEKIERLARALRGR
jgi:hypothetical protein